MENQHLSITAGQLRDWLEINKNVVILDVRPIEQRQEWYIPGSIHVDAYQSLNANDPTVLDEISIPQNVPVVTVCGAGRTSTIAAKELRKKGVEAFSLEGGMKAWSTAWNTATFSFGAFEVIQFRRTGKGCLSYMLISDREAIVIDASLPVEVYEKILSEQRLSLKFTIDTHIHADHISRSKQLAEKLNVPFYLPLQDKVIFNYKPIIENAKLTAGDVSITAIHTPGHTLESTCYLVDDKILFTGDTLFIDGIGRPDLKASTAETKHKASLLYNSLQRLMAMNANIIVLPGHTNKPVDFNKVPIQASLGTIKKNVTMLRLGEDEFVRALLERIPPTPTNYLSIVEKNISGEFAGINTADLEAGANRCSIA
jgi:glyoxylase-like metal-dependent hydrolase (beta-lactamase superfamily II)/rhodanese-related sulfurtransferase